MSHQSLSHNLCVRVSYHITCVCVCVLSHNCISPNSSFLYSNAIINFMYSNYQLLRFCNNMKAYCSRCYMPWHVFKFCEFDTCILWYIGSIQSDIFQVHTNKSIFSEMFSPYCEMSCSYCEVFGPCCEGYISALSLSLCVCVYAYVRAYICHCIITFDRYHINDCRTGAFYPSTLPAGLPQPTRFVTRPQIIQLAKW